MPDKRSEKGPKGCGFLVQKLRDESIRTPEKFSQAQRDFARVAGAFVREEILPAAASLEARDARVRAEALKDAGKLGLLAAAMPQPFGGADADLTACMNIAESLGHYPGWSASFSAQISTGILPLLFFGSAEQKATWLPKIGRGEAVCAYAISERTSGSDALAAKTVARQAPDGRSYAISGSKIWVPNADIADLFIVFCQINGTKFSAILVESHRPGITVGAPKDTLGQRATPVFEVDFDDVSVPAANVFGAVAKGHRVAFNTQNFERIESAATSLGCCKRALMLAATYAKNRRQFGQPISQFGAIRSKLARMATRAWTLESMSYRVAGAVDARLERLCSDSDTYRADALGAIEEFGVEAAIIKVYGTEAAVFLSEQALQIHASRGYSADSEVERIFRDAPAGLLAAGTNEINRMLIPSMILKRTMKGQLNLFEMIEWVESTLDEDDSNGDVLRPAGATDTSALAAEERLGETAQKLVLYTLNRAIQKHMADLREQQEILLDLADMIIALFAIDSTIRRTRQVLASGERGAIEIKRAATRLQISYCTRDIRQTAARLLNHLGATPCALAPFECPMRIDEIALERQIAVAVLDADGKYPF